MRKVVLVAGAAVLVVLGASVLVAGGAEEEVEDVELFDGKVISMHQTGSTGGSTDRLARLLAPWFVKYLPGEPEIRVIDAPMAVPGRDWFHTRAPRDGVDVLVESGSGITSQMLGMDYVTWDMNEWEPLIAQAANSFLYASPETGFESCEDLPEIHEDLVWGAHRPVEGNAFVAWWFHLMDLNPQIVWGYEGTGAAHAAFLGGEINVDRQGAAFFHSTVQPLIEQGEAVAIMQQGHLDDDGEWTRDPVAPDVPHPAECYEAVYGEEPTGAEWGALRAMSGFYGVQKIFFLHRDDPPEMVQAWKEAAAQIAQDPEFLEEAREQFGEYPWTVGDRLETLLATTLGAAEDAHLLDEFLREHHGDYLPR